MHKLLGVSVRYDAYRNDNLSISPLETELIHKKKGISNTSRTVLNTPVSDERYGNPLSDIVCL